MLTVMPAVFLDDDAQPARPMANHGALLGFSTARAVWRFGFEPGGPQAKAFGAFTLTPLYVLSWHSGRPVETILLPWGAVVPGRFMHAIEARL